MIQNKEVLEQIREEAVKELNSYDCRILVCSGKMCIRDSPYGDGTASIKIRKILEDMDA